MGAASSKRRAKKAEKRKQKSLRNNESASQSAATSSSTKKKGDAERRSEDVKSAECTACMANMAHKDHVRLRCKHLLCVRCAVTCIDDADQITASSAHVVCPTCLSTSQLENNSITKKVLSLHSSINSRDNREREPSSRRSKHRHHHMRHSNSTNKDQNQPPNAVETKSKDKKKVPVTSWEKQLVVKANATGAKIPTSSSSKHEEKKLPFTREFQCGRHGHYRLKKMLGKGGFGEVYQCENQRSFVMDAIKLENVNNPRHQLKKEWKLYCELGANANSSFTGVPRVYWLGRVENYRCMLMEGLGMSLQAKFKGDGKTWAIETICRLGIQLINVLEYIHSKKIMHRDLKPGNIMLDKKNEKLYLIDYGLSTYFADSQTGEHIPQLAQPRVPAREGALVGTATFCSIRAHEHVRLSRRDDLEEASYLLAYFVRGNLPWQVPKSIEKPRRNKMIYSSKKETTAATLFRYYPKQLEKICHYARKLDYDATPDYNMLREQLRDLLKERGASIDIYEPFADALMASATTEKPKEKK